MLESEKQLNRRIKKFEKLGMGGNAINEKAVLAKLQKRIKEAFPNG